MVKNLLLVTFCPYRTSNNDSLNWICYGWFCSFEQNEVKRLKKKVTTRSNMVKIVGGIRLEMSLV